MENQKGKVKEKKEYNFIQLNTKQLIIGLIMLPFYMGILRYWILEPLMGFFIDDNVLLELMVRLLRNIIMLAAYIILLRKNIALFLKDFFKSRVKDNILCILQAFLILSIARTAYAIVVVTMRLIMQDRYNELFGGGPQNEVMLDGIRNNFPVLLILVTIIIAPILEEIVFRYVVYHALRRINKYLAFIAVPLFFSVIHVLDEIGSGRFIQAAFYMLTYLTIAIPLTILYEKRRNIVFCIIMHATINLIAAVN